jgi:hypothetical protein
MIYAQTHSTTYSFPHLQALKRAAPSPRHKDSTACPSQQITQCRGSRVEKHLITESSKPDSFSTPSNLRHQSQDILPYCSGFGFATDVVRTSPTQLMINFSWIAALLIGDQTALSKCQIQQFRMGLYFSRLLY